MSSDRLMLYRGQQMPTGAFENIKDNAGGLLSIPNFFSTTANIEIAEIFAGRSVHDTTISCILFEIDVDPAIDTFPFANTQGYSYFDEGERDDHVRIVRL